MPPPATDLGRRAATEAVATAFLLAAVVGSGIMGDRLSAGSVGLALLANTVATGAALVALILAFGPVSGAHMNPAVTLAEAVGKRLPRGDVPAYVGCQIAGAVVGVVLAHGMFGERLLSWSAHERSSGGELLAEAVATFGLLAVIRGSSRQPAPLTAFAVGAYITAAYWFTASTSFANPAVTIARAMTDTFSGIRPADVPGFLGAQLVGATAATVFFDWLGAETPRTPKETEMQERTVERVIFACIHNAGRSQMAAAFFNELADPARASAVSAGTHPADRVHAEVVTAMRETGIDLAAARPRLLTEELAREARLLVTMGCGEECPVVPGLAREDWPLPDPKGRPIEEVRRTRDEIGARVRQLVESRGWARA